MRSYELWHFSSGNLVGAYATLKEAHEVISKYYPKTDHPDLGLGRMRGDGSFVRYCLKCPRHIEVDATLCRFHEYPPS